MTIKYLDSKRFSGTSTGNALGGWDISTVSYTSKSFSVASQDTLPVSVFFKSDGTKMFVLGPINDTLYQYSLSTAWDVSTASYDSKSFYVGTQDGSSHGFFFKSDGIKMYVIGYSGDKVYQYTLSTAWDVSTASYDSVSVSVVSQEANPRGIFLSPDGTKMYITGSNGDNVYQYTLSTAWDLSTASYDSVYLDVSGQDSYPSDLFFKSDGTKMYVAGPTSNYVYQYTLSTAWNLSTASYDSVSFYIGTQDTKGRGLFLSPDGTKMYMLGYTTDTVYQYSIGSAESDYNSLTNVQDNSIFVETDTARKYWLEPEVPSTSASTATTENDNGVNEQVMSSANFEFIGEKVVNTSSALYGLDVNKIGFMMKKREGSPTGTATACVMDGNADILYTFGTVDVSTLPSTYTWTYFTNTVSTYTLTNGNYIGIKYSGGDASNRIGVYWDNGANYDGTNSIGSEESGGVWNDRSTQDFRFKIFTGTASTPATWTMQPTWGDDFSTDNWTDSGANVGISNDVMNFDIGRITTNQSSYYQLSSALSDTKWTMRLHDVNVTTKSGGVEVFIGVSSNTSGAQTAQDFIGLNLGDNTANPVLGGVDSDGGIIARLAGDYTYSLSTTYNIEIIRESATSYRIKVFSNSGFDSTALFSQSYTCTATTTGLQYVKFANGQVAGSTENIIGTCSKIEIYNGVTSVT